MSLLRQIGSVTGVALRSVPARLEASLVVVIGLAVAVAVFIAVLALANGFDKAATNTGSALRAIIMDADSESESDVPRDSLAKLLDEPGIRRLPDGKRVASAELLTFIGLKDPRTGLNAYVAVRGVGVEVQAVRPQTQIVEGRMFNWGAREMVIGRALQYRLGEMPIGSQVAMPDGNWTITGVFVSGGDMHESELMGDVDVLLNANRRNTFSTVTVGLDGPEGFHRLSSAVKRNPALTFQVRREDEFYASISRNVSELLKFVARGIGALMMFGAIFAALNTMYATVTARAGEIATLRAIGFSSGAVVVSVIIEAVLLALVGALIGVALTWLLMDSSNISMVSGVGRSQLTFGVSIGPSVILTGVATAVLVALIGGSLAAARAARLSIIEALRMS